MFEALGTDQSRFLLLEACKADKRLKENGMLLYAYLV
jgi:hypothetical protein